MWFSIFDFEYSKETLYKEPKYYIIGLKNLHFQTWKFWAWIFYGFISSALIFIIAVIPFETLDGSIWIEGNFAYFGVVIVANLKVLLGTNTHSVFSTFFIFGSIVLFLVCYYVETLMPSFPTYGSVI